MAQHMTADGKTPLDLTEQQPCEGTVRWLARLVHRAALVDAAFANIRDAGRQPPAPSEAADDMALMRAHQAYGQVRSAAHAGNRFLSAVFRFTEG